MNFQVDFYGSHKRMKCFFKMNKSPLHLVCHRLAFLIFCFFFFFLYLSVSLFPFISLFLFTCVYDAKYFDVGL